MCNCLFIKIAVLTFCYRIIDYSIHNINNFSSNFSYFNKLFYLNIDLTNFKIKSLLCIISVYYDIVVFLIYWLLVYFAFIYKIILILVT